MSTAENGDVQERPMYEWGKFKPSMFCGCFNFVLQMVFVGSLGSFMFGLNLAMFNTASSTIFSEFQMCGVTPRNLEMFDALNLDDVSICEEIPLCQTQCLVTDAIDDITRVQCPGGHNYLGCPSFKWYNAVMGCAILIGGAVGSLSGGNFLKFGRRTVLIVMQIIFAIGVVSTLTANSYSAMLWARLLTGFGVGLATVAPPTYMSEVTPPAKRGSYGVMAQIMIVIGLFVANLIGLPLSDPRAQANAWTPSGFQSVWWRVMVGMGIIPVIFGLYLLLFVYSFETPLYYVEQNRHRDARELIERLYAKDNVDTELAEMVQLVKESEAAKLSGMSFSNALKDKEYRNLIFISCVISAFQQFGGINVFMTSSNELFRRAGLTGRWQTIMSIIMTGINVVMTFPALYLIERLGRRTLLFWASCGQFIMVVPSAISYWTESDADAPGKVTQYLAVIGIIGFVVFFAVAYGPVLWVYLFEIFPIEIKDVAAGAAAAVNWIAGIVMVFAALSLNNKVSFTLFAVLQLIGTVFIFFFMRETKGLPIGASPYISRTNNNA